jgi:hypothetical protein
MENSLMYNQKAQCRGTVWTKWCGIVEEIGVFYEWRPNISEE